MHFDTYEAFTRAVYRHAGVAPASVHDEYLHIMNRAIRSGNRQLVEDLSNANRAVTGIAVSLMQSCYHVHETSTSHKAPGDDLLGYRIQEACESLIPGWQIVIQVMNGHAHVMLFDDFDRQQSFPSLRESLSSQVSDALLSAQCPPEKRRKSKQQHIEDPDHGFHL